MRRYAPAPDNSRIGSAGVTVIPRQRRANDHELLSAVLATISREVDVPAANQHGGKGGGGGSGEVVGAGARRPARVTVHARARAWVGWGGDRHTRVRAAHVPPA